MKPVKNQKTARGKSDVLLPRQSILCRKCGRLKAADHDDSACNTNAPQNAVLNAVDRDVPLRGQ